jgi:hypothetical protein
MTEKNIKILYVNDDSSLRILFQAQANKVNESFDSGSVDIEIASNLAEAEDKINQIMGEILSHTIHGVLFILDANLSPGIVNGKDGKQMVDLIRSHDGYNDDNVSILGNTAMNNPDYGQDIINIALLRYQDIQSRVEELKDNLSLDSV